MSSIPDPPAGFSNRSVSVSELPDFRAVNLNDVAPGYHLHVQLTNAVFWLVLVVIAQVVSWLPVWEFSLPWWVSAALLGLLALSAVHAVFDARFRGWALREHDFIYRHGVIWRKTIILPFTRIQHVETASGPIERLFGLMRVKCFTAGGTTGDLTAVGLHADDARRVQQYLLEQIREHGDAAVGQAPGHEGSDHVGD
ncbi:PH domain-containing protein [Wenzhouxiangella sp. AB-CW3]|uniref:PH domain-containing protein n=1 Tax=Wenzhouxiangella sp. AB-CW3 TaxID=2771012 RepID=UPI00168BBB22|nr:PH domain-containing protein [Wenzhouxiangella sp. AB-CW3]QOC21326.1 PH domain-containing protein [Wenzhouxiangella sp. AB-CW3]